MMHAVGRVGKASVAQEADLVAQWPTPDVPVLLGTSVGGGGEEGSAATSHPHGVTFTLEPLGLNPVSVERMGISITSFR